MRFVVGGVVRTHEEQDALPVGTILTGGLSLSSHTHFLKQESGEWLHFSHPGIRTPVGRLANQVDYRIVYLPDDYEPDAVDELASDLWNERTKVICEVTPWEYTADWDQVESIHRAVYKELAKYVIGRFGLDETKAVTEPSAVIDGDGDRWERQPNGNYRMRSRTGAVLYSQESTLNDLVAGFGVREEIA